MKKNLIYTIVVMTAIVFTGCMKTPNVNYNAAMHKDISKIAIVPPNQKKELTIFYYNHPGMSFGLVGGLMAAAEFSSKTSTYNKLIAPTKFNVNAYFLTKLTYYLKQQHYKVSLLPANPKRTSELMKQYPKANTDAYLDIVLYDVGYIAGGPSATYKPTVKVAARLVKKSNNAILYDKHLSVGENFALAKEVDYLGCNTADCHKDFDTLKANAIKSVRGLKKALDKIAKHLALSLKRGK